MSIKFAIVIPYYNCIEVVFDTLRSIHNQTVLPDEIIISDDNSSIEQQLHYDQIVSLFPSFSDKVLLRIFRNQHNLGYQKNLASALNKVTATHIILSGQDDIYPKTMVEEYKKIYTCNPNVSCISRAYHWFENGPCNPVRIKASISNLDYKISKNSYKKNTLINYVTSLDQLSALSFRRELYESSGISRFVFPCHTSPFFWALAKGHELYYVSKSMVAVRIATSQTRLKPSIYKPSPTLTWTMHTKRFLSGLPIAREILIKDYFAKNYIGLLQIRNYAGFVSWINEVHVMIKLNKSIILSPVFISINFLCLALPRRWLIAIVDNVKKLILSAYIQKKHSSTFMRDWLNGSF